MAKKAKGESRAAAVGRKRQQVHDPVSAYKPDKRQKVTHDDSSDDDYLPPSDAAQDLSKAGKHLQGVEVEAIFPEPLQKWVRKQITETGLPACQILDNMLKPSQPYGKQAHRFALDWKRGWLSFLPSYDFTHLQQLVRDPNAFAKPLDLNILLGKGAFGEALQEVQKQNPGMPATAVLFELVKDSAHHREACHSLQALLSDNARTNDAAQPATATESQQEAPTTTNTVARESSSSASEGEIFESDDEHIDENGRQPPSDSEDGDTSENDDTSDGDDDMDEDGSDRIVRLNDLSVEEQALQYRYFHLTDPGDSVYCLCCGERGHMQSHCPALTCQHCNSTTHFSRGCPQHKKCERCRERGHLQKNCTKRSKPAGARGDECDICGERGHAEEECAGLWMTFKPEAESITKIPANEMVVSCYNCGAKGHWGDDCKDLPDYVFKDIMHPTWSANNAKKYIIGAEKPAVRNLQEVVDLTGSVEEHQLAQIGDWS